ncbi:MAG: hypothetical protein H7257_08320 [Taibaiella sp.]|nr:hypothetical protein [Taibaiella sp.]
MEDEIVSYILGDSMRIAAALSLYGTQDEVYNRIIVLLGKQLDVMAKKRNLRLTFDMNRDRKDSIFSYSFTIEQNLPFSIAFSWEGKYFKDGYWGFTSENDNHNEFHVKFNSLFEKGYGPESVWPWYKELDKYGYFDDQTYIDISNGTFAKYIDEKLHEILEKLNLPELQIA